MNTEAAIPGITKISNGFIIRVTKKDPLTGKTIERSATVNTPDIQEAIKTKEEMVVALRNELESGKDNAKDISSLTYEAYVQFYQKQKLNNGIARANVVKLDWLVFNQFVVPHIRQVKICNINKRVVLHFSDKLREMLNENGVPFSICTYVKAWSLFKASIRYAVKIGVIQDDPTHLISPKFPNARPAKQKPFLTLEQASKLLNAAEEEGTTEYAVIALGLVLGLRSAEIKALTYGSVDIVNNLLIVDKSYHAGVLNNKVKNSNNFVLPLIGAAHFAVKRHYDATAHKKKNTDIFLPSLRSKKHFDSAWLNNLLERLCNKCAIPVISAHGLRVSANSILLSQTGANPEIVSKILNHHTSAMRLHYTQVNIEQSRKLLGSVWNPDNK